MVNQFEMEDAPEWPESFTEYRAGDAARGHVCPFCPEFIVANSRVVRLQKPMEPDTLDGRFDRRTGRPYYFDARPVGMKARWWAHSDCVEVWANGLAY